MSAREWLIRCGIFAITGSTSMVITRQIANTTSAFFHPDVQERSVRNGPISYQTSYLISMMPLYSLTLYTYATLFRRQDYFGKLIKRMWRLK